MLEQILGADLRVNPEILRQVAELAPHRVLVAQHVDGFAVHAFSVALPLSASCKVARVRISEDLPAPFGPSRPNMPRGMSRLTLSRRARRCCRFC